MGAKAFGGRIDACLMPPKMIRVSKKQHGRKGASTIQRRWHSGSKALVECLGAIKQQKNLN